MDSDDEGGGEREVVTPGLVAGGARRAQPVMKPRQRREAKRRRARGDMKGKQSRRRARCKVGAADTGRCMTRPECAELAR